MPPWRSSGNWVCNSYIVLEVWPHLRAIILLDTYLVKIVCDPSISFSLFPALLFCKQIKRKDNIGHEFGYRDKQKPIALVMYPANLQGGDRIYYMVWCTTSANVKVASVVQLGWNELFNTGSSSLTLTFMELVLLGCLFAAPPLVHQSLSTRALGNHNVTCSTSFISCFCIM